MNKRYVSIDYLRAFFSVCVVIYHTYDSNSLDYSRHTFTVSHFILYYILSAAVPSFFLIASFLYMSKHRTMGYMLHRVYALSLLAVFWTIIWRIYIYGFHGFLVTLPTSADKLVTFILTAGWTQNYYLVELCLVTVLAHFAKKMSTKTNIFLFLSSLFILIMSPLIAVRYSSNIFVAHWNPLNFLVYPFTAVLIYRSINHLQQMRKQYQFGSVILVAAIGILVSMFEWKYYINPSLLIDAKNKIPYALPEYMRPSILISSVLFLLSALLIKLPSNPVIRFMSRYSLALYCLHAFTVHALRDVSLLAPLYKSKWIMNIIYVVVSYTAVFVLRMFLKDKYLLNDPVKAEDKVPEFQNTHDSLTGLYNRAYAEAEIRRITAGRQFPVSFISAKLNGLERVNYTLGHEAGNRLIIGAAMLLKKAFRRSDVTVRTGGDKFLIILHEAGEEAVVKSVERLRTYQSAYNKKGDTPPMHISLGTSTTNSAYGIQQGIKEAEKKMEEDSISLAYEHEFPVK